MEQCFWKEGIQSNFPLSNTTAPLDTPHKQIKTHRIGSQNKYITTHLGKRAQSYIMHQKTELELKKGTYSFVSNGFSLLDSPILRTSIWVFTKWRLSLEYNMGPRVWAWIGIWFSSRRAKGWIEGYCRGNHWWRKQPTLVTVRVYGVGLIRNVIGEIGGILWRIEHLGVWLCSEVGIRVSVWCDCGVVRWRRCWVCTHSMWCSGNVGSEVGIRVSVWRDCSVVRWRKCWVCRNSIWCFGNVGNGGLGWKNPFNNNLGY